VQEENEAEEEVLDGVASVMAVALRRWGDGAMPFIEPLMPAVGQVRPVNNPPTTHMLLPRCHAARIMHGVLPASPHLAHRRPAFAATDSSTRLYG
jgi:hypothetical protein